MLKQIVCAIDLSTASAPTVHRAIQLMQSQDSQLTLLHCVEQSHLDFMEFMMKTAENPPTLLLNEAQTQLLAVKNQFPHPEKVDVVIETGNITTSVGRVAENTHADLVMLGTSDKSALQRTFLGSNALKVLRHSPCSVLVVKKPCLSAYQRILIGVELSQELDSTLAFLRLLAPEAELVLVHCYEIPFEGTLNHHADFNDMHLTAYRTEIRDQATKRMQVLTQKLPIDPLKLTTIVTQGDPADTLQQLANDHQCDLMVLNKNNLTTLDSLILGSVTNEVVNASTIDTLVLNQD